jgi:hypothetical protein
MLLQGLLTRLVGNRDAGRSVPGSAQPKTSTPAKAPSERVTRQCEDLPDYITSGRYEDETGRPVLVQSGRGAESPADRPPPVRHGHPAQTRYAVRGDARRAEGGLENAH